MALPVLNNTVSYPDPLHVEIPAEDEERIIPCAPVSKPAGDLEYGAQKNGKYDDSSLYRLPPVVSSKEFGRALPDPPGTIKTGWLETSYQQTLARVRERIVVQRQPPRNAEEWRYPKAPVPARPDLTRSLPVLIRNEVNKDSSKWKKKKKHQRSETYPRVAADNIAGEARVRFLPPLPMHIVYQNLFHDLSSSLPSTLLSKKLKSTDENETYRPTYLPFVGSASLHPKTFSETEIREKPYAIPSLCLGCRGDVGVKELGGYINLDKDEGMGSEIESQEVKGQDGESELQPVKDSAIAVVPQTNCFGCVLSSIPHKPRRVGGGFAFFSKEPHKYTFVSKEDVVTKDTRGPDSSVLYSTENLAVDNDFCMSVEKPPEPLRPVREMTVPRQKPTKQKTENMAVDNDFCMSVEKLPEPLLRPVREMTVPRQKPTQIPEWILDMVHHHGDGDHKVKNYYRHCYACLHIMRQLLPDYNSKDHSDCSSSGIGTSVMSEAARLEEEARFEEEARLRMEARAREKQRLEEERLRREEYEKERRRHLYKAPKAFQPKKTESKTTEAQNPFSKNRSLDIPKNEGFKVIKSTEALTKTIETKLDEKNWKEPEKFELKKPVPKITSTEWKPPQRKEHLSPETVETPPPPPPPPVTNKPTIPIKPNKREQAEPIVSLRQPVETPPKKKLEKTKFVKSPVKKVENQPFPASPPPPEPVRAKTPPPKKKPVVREVTPPPRPIEVPPRVIEKIKPVTKEKPTPVKKEEKLPRDPPKTIKKTEKVKRKPVVFQKDDKKRPVKPVVKKKQPPKEPAVNPKEVKEPTPVKQITSPPLPEDQTPESPTLPPKEPTPPPPNKPTPPPPKDPTPTPPPPTPPLQEPTPPPPKEPTPPPREPTPPPREPTSPPREPTSPPREPTSPPREPTSPPREPTSPPREPTSPPREPTSPPREPTSPPREPTSPPREPTSPPREPTSPPREPTPPPREATPVKVIPPLPPKEPTPPSPELEPEPAPEPEPPKGPTPEPEPQPETEVEPELEPEPPKIPTPEPVKLAPVVKPPKKTRNVKSCKPAPAKIPIAVKAKKIPEKPQKKSKPSVVPIMQKAPESVKPPPFRSTPKPVEPIIEPIVEPLAPPLTPPQSQEPIIMRRRRREQYKHKKRKWRKTRATPNDAGSPDPVMVDALDYLAKYCIVHKQRIPHYQRVFNGALRKKGIQVEETAPPSVPTVANLKAQYSTLSSISRGSMKPDYDNASVTTETSGYASVVNDESVSIGDDFKSAFGLSETINEEDYISPLYLTAPEQESSDEDEVRSGGDDGGQRPTNFFGTDAFAAEDYLDKLTFQLDNIYKKSNALELKVVELSDTRRRTIANFARNEFPEILRPGFDPSAVEKKSPKGKKEKVEVKFISVVEDLGYLNPDEESRVEAHPENDDWVLSRLTDYHWKMLESDSSVRRLDVEQERAQEKYDFTQERIATLLDEKKRISVKESSLKKQELQSRAATIDDFRRKQSVLYQNMNPIQEYQVEVTDLESTLRQVNSYLITEKECQYIYHVLDLPQRHRIDFKLFTVVAALSEKVSRLEPLIRKLINKINFEALEVKMQHAKELFFLLADEDDETDGCEVPISNLVVELKAGGLKPEHVELVVDKFNREGKGTVDFLDFLTYIPLFIDIHENIISDPLNWMLSSR